MFINFQKNTSIGKCSLFVVLSLFIAKFIYFYDSIEPRVVHVHDASRKTHMYPYTFKVGLQTAREPRASCIDRDDLEHHAA